MVINWSLNIMGYNGNLNSNNRGNRLKKNIFWNMGYDRNKFNTEKKNLKIWTAIIYMISFHTSIKIVLLFVLQWKDLKIWR